MNFGKGVEHGISDIIEETLWGIWTVAVPFHNARCAAVAGCVTSAWPQLHLLVPVLGFEEDEEYRGAAEDGVLRYALDEAVQGPCSPVGEFCAESVAADVGHVVLLGERRYCGGLVFFVEGIAEVNKVGEAPPDAELGFHEG